MNEQIVVHWQRGSTIASYPKGPRFVATETYRQVLELAQAPVHFIFLNLVIVIN
jgi:hypothetical protein